MTLNCVWWWDWSLRVWGMWSIPSLPLLSGLFWIRIQFERQRELFKRSRGIIIIIIIIIIIRAFLISVNRLIDSKSPQVSRTLLSILAVLNNAVVWMVSTRPPTSKSSSPFSNPLVTVPNAPITIGIIVTCMFRSFFNSLTRSRYLSLFAHSFSFILWSAGTAKSTIWQVLFFFVVDYH